MSYHLQIKKLSTNQLSKRVIPIEDWLGIIQNDDDFSYIVDEGNIVSVIFSAEEDHSESVEWNQGTIDAKQPSDLLAKKMILLANKLDAQVVTDKGICFY